MEKIESLEILPGFVLAITVGLIAWWLSSFYIAMDALVVGIVLGIIIRIVIGEKSKLMPGLVYAPKFFIPIGIIFYGTNLRFDKIIAIVDLFGIIHLVMGIALTFAIAIYLGRKFGIGDKSSLLIATGTSICGASAIAIVTPIIKGESEDTSVALLVITIFGLIGMLVYPIAQYWLNLTSTYFAIFCSTTLPMTGLIKTAVADLGENVIRLALAIKMVRTMMIIPAIVFLCWFTQKKESKKSIFTQIPWFMWIFVFMGLLFSFIPGFHSFADNLKPLAGILFTIALTSVGLTCDFKEIVNAGGAPMAVAVASWSGLVLTFFAGYLLFII